MNIEYLIQLLENKLIFLTNSKVQAYNIGDLATINSIEAEMAGISDTLYKLRLLQTATQAAAGANSDISSMITAGIEAVQNIQQNPDATLCLDVYDISSYATDPLHEQKIRDILLKMGVLDSVEKIHEYIHNAAPESPLTGQMVFDAVLKYGVDARLVLALIELDSFFGTLGIGASTFNPGNVGNTGSATQTYASWEDGVAAVADWLNRHRKTVAEPITPPPPPEPVSVIENPTPEPIPEPQIPEPQTPEPEPIPEPQIEPIIENPVTTTPEIIPEPEPEPIPEIIPTEDLTASSTPIAANIKAKGKKYLAKKRTRKLG